MVPVFLLRLQSQDAFNIPEHAEGPVLRRASSDEAGGGGGGESSDDILAKYRFSCSFCYCNFYLLHRKKPEDTVDGAGGEADIERQEQEEAPLQELDRENMEESFVFHDARRKLRLVLSEVRTKDTAPVAASYSEVLYRFLQVELPVLQQSAGEEGELVSLLQVRLLLLLLLLAQVMLAQAINQEDRNAAAQLRETLRCLSLFDQVPGCKKWFAGVRTSWTCRRAVSS